MKYTGNTPFGLRQTDQSSSGIFSAGVERITIDANGNIGIGTTTPTQSLHVEGSIFIKNNSFIRSKDGGSTVYDLLGVLSNGHVQVGQPNRGLKFRGGGSTSDIYFELAGSTQFILKGDSGNVGIGTTSPSTSLHIANADNAYITLEDTNLNNQVGVRYKTADYEWIAGVHGGEDSFKISNHHSFGTNDFLVVKNDGKVGIGTTTPFKTFQVNGDINAFKLDGTDSYSLSGVSATDGNYRFAGMRFDRTNNVAKFGHYLNSGLGEMGYLSVNSSGNVGIGISSTSARLHVHRADSSAVFAQFTNSTTGTGGDGLIVGVDNDESGFVWQRENNYLRFGTYGQERMRITSDGKVGIGWTAPPAKLSVSGGSSSGDTETFYISSAAYNGNLLNQAASPHVITLLAGKAETGGNNLATSLKLVNVGTETAGGNFSDIRSRSYGEIDKDISGLANFKAEYRSWAPPTGPNTLSHHYGLLVNPLYVGANGTVTNNYGLYINPGTTATNNFGVYQAGFSVDNFFEGNVGIGTTSPTHKLQVAGTFKSVGINDSASAQAIFINGNGEIGIGVTNQTTALDVGGVFQFSTTTDLLQINNNTNTGGINFSGGNSRIYFGGHRAIEGSQTGTNLVLGEGYSNVQVHANSAFVVNGAQTLGGNLTVSGRTDLQRDLRLRGTDASPNLGVVRMYVDANNTLFIDAANDGNNRVEINAAGDLTVPGIITAQEFRTEFITQTVIFESGSTAFGNSADDNHDFTGTITAQKDDTGVLSGLRVDPLIIRNDSMSTLGPWTRMKFSADWQDLSAVATTIDSSGVGGSIALATSQNGVDVLNRLEISKDGNVGIGIEPQAGQRLTLGLPNVNGDGILLQNTTSSVEVAKLYQDNGTEGILDLSYSNNNNVKIRSNGSSYFDGGTVGFGTQTPSIDHRVDIVGNLKVGGTGAGFGDYLEILGFGAGNNITLRQFDSNSGLHTFNFDTANEGLFKFSLGGSTELVRFDAQRNYFANNVGIGTLSAATTLDIVDEFPTIRLEDPVAGAYSLLSGDGGNILIAADEGNQDGGSHIAFKTDTTERARIDSAGNFGIGTSSPGAKLDVNGEIRASLFRDRDDTNYYINPSGATSAILAGKVGLGTTSPTVRLTVNENSTSFAAAITNSNSGGQGLQVTGGFGISNVLQLRSYNGFEVMRVRGDGRVGIGTSTPSTALEVMSNNTDGQVIITRAANPDQKLYLRSGIGSGEARVASQYSLELKSGLGGDPNYDLTLATGQGEAVRIDGATNNVGIGTASPQRALDVNGDIQNNGVLRRAGLVFVKSDGVSTKIGPANATAGDVSVHSSGTLGTGDQLAVFKSSGNVGIGTTSPSDKLTVQDGTITSTDATGTNYAKLDRFSGLTLKGNGAGSRGVQTPNTDALTFGTNATERMRISSSGNVGIGNTAPTNKLDVTGTASVTNLRIGSNASGEGIIRYFAGSGQGIGITTGALDSSGIGLYVAHQNDNRNVGIGTTTPSEKLTVAGKVSLGETATVTQTAKEVAGDPAGAVMETFDANVHVGAFIDYTVFDAGRDNLRSGTIQMVFNAAGEARFTDNSTTDIGDSSPGYFQVTAIAPNAEIQFVSPDPTWSVRYHVRYL